MRNVNSHLLVNKMEDAVTHYINSQTGEPVQVDPNSLALNVHDDGGGRVVTLMQSQNFTSQMCRQVSVAEQVGEGNWGDELLDPEARLAALVDHLAFDKQTRTSHHQTSHHKVPSMRGDVDTSVVLESPMRLFNGQVLNEPMSVNGPLPPLPPLQGMKRCQDWFYNKNKSPLKANTPMLTEPEDTVLVLGASASPVHSKQQNRKSLPHKKRISKKLKRNPGGSTPQQDIVEIQVNDEIHHEEILPDNFVSEVHHQEQLHEDTHHISHEVRSVFICQLCGDYYGEEQYKFYQHLKQHYDPAIIIENPVSDIGIDKMTNTCIVDNVGTLPDSFVELSLENTVPKTIYQQVDKHVLYTSSEKTLNYSSNKMQYSIASMDKEPSMPTTEAEKTDLYETLAKLELYTCGKCNKTFRKQKQFEYHLREAHNANSKYEMLNEFSEPEDLMDGIHVEVAADGGEGGEGGEQYGPPILPHLTIENGHVHQDHVRHWYMRNGVPVSSSLPPCAGEYCPVCPAPDPAPAPAPPPAHPPAPPPPPPPSPPPPPPPMPLREPPPQPHSPQQLKDEMLRIFEVAEEPNNATADSSYNEADAPPERPPAPQDGSACKKVDSKKKKASTKQFVCVQCDRVFVHRNSLHYHMLSHDVKQHPCKECGKFFYTIGALKIHKRMHNDDRPFKCDECDKGFRQWSDIKYHKVSRHSTQKHFKCEFCSKEFARKYSLNVHRRIHTGEKNYKCEYCNKSFSASSYRLSHMRTHTGDRPYVCQECGKAFRVTGDLRRHKFVHEKRRIKTEEQLKKTKDKDKKKPTLINTSDDLKNQDQTDPKIDEPKSKNTRSKSPNALKSSSPNNKETKNSKKVPAKKLGDPNVTVGHKINNRPTKVNTEDGYNVVAYDTTPTNGGGKKFKDFSVSEYDNKVKDDYSEQSIVSDYKSDVQRVSENRDFATLRPMFRDEGVCSDVTNMKSVVMPQYENTDGKMTVYTHVEKSRVYSGSVTNCQTVVSDVRKVTRDILRDTKNDVLHDEYIDNMVLNKMNSFYDLAPV